MASHLSVVGTSAVGEVSAAYSECRHRIEGLVLDLGDERAGATPVPACPAWSVRDVLAHLTGVTTDALTGRLDGVGSDEWTRAQVESRRGCGVAGILAEWDANAGRFEALLDEIGGAAHQAVADIVTHEQDLRGALGRPGARTVAGLRIGLVYVATAFAAAAAERGLQVQAHATDVRLTVGSAQPDAAVTGTSFELLRAMTGRRSVPQLRELRWTRGDPDLLVPAFTFGPFRPALHDITE